MKFIPWKEEWNKNCWELNESYQLENLLDLRSQLSSMEESNGSKISILCAAVEESLSINMTSHSKLVWLKYNEPSTYAKLVITDRLQEFLDHYAESYHRQQVAIERQLTIIFHSLVKNNSTKGR